MIISPRKADFLALAAVMSSDALILTGVPPQKCRIPGFTGVKIMTTRMTVFTRASRIFLVMVLVVCFSASAYAGRKDVVVMTNGDHFTGQVKRLQNGLLYVETDYVAGNIGLDWNQVQSVQSTATYRIVLNNGQRLEGKIEKTSAANATTEDFLIREATEEVQVPSATVVNIDSRKPTFWRQLQGAIDMGYSFTSGNSQSTLNLDTSAAYKTAGWEGATSFDSTFNGQSGSSKTNREDVQLAVAKFLNRNSFVVALSDFLHSSQQDLTLRTTLGGGYGRYLIRTTNSNLAWIGGAVYTHESFDTSNGQPSDQNMEAVAGLQYSFIRFNVGELDSKLQVFPGLTDAGRVRLKTNNSLTINLRNNFHLAFTFWDNFDSRPPMTAKRNELGISTGVGWSF
jgi:putative salt-induced outer membrane protein YdiY